MDTVLSLCVGIVILNLNLKFHVWLDLSWYRGKSINTEIVTVEIVTAEKVLAQMQSVHAQLLIGLL